MKEKVNRLAVLTKGIIKENPNLVLLLGTCPTLATTSSAFNGMGMGIAATAVLICSNIVISLLAKIMLYRRYRRIRNVGTVHRTGIC